MKKLYSVPAAFACAALLLACNDDEPAPVTPKVELKAGAVTAFTLSFTITPADAQEVAYAVVKQGETVPDAAAVFVSGAKGRPDAAEEYTVSGLEVETAYVIAVAAVNGNVYSTVAKLEMTTYGIPAVTVTAGEASAAALSFTITPAYAQEVAYMAIKKGEAVPGVAAILKSGTRGRADAAEEYTVTGLEAETAYIIVAAAVKGDDYSAVAMAEMTTDAIPTVTVTAGKVFPTALAFTVTPSAGVEKAAYVCVKQGEAIPSNAEELFESGTAIEDMTAPVKVEGLEVETAYVIAVAVATAQDYSEVQTLEMTTGYDEVIVAAHASAAAYFGNDAHPDKQTGRFVIGLDNIPWNSQGVAIGAGTKHQFCFYSDLTANPFDVIPADGTYKLDVSDSGDSGDKWTVGNNSYTWWAEIDEMGDRLYDGSYSEAEMTLTRSGDNYEIVMTGLTDSGTTFKVTYIGSIKFKNLSANHRNLDAASTETVYYGMTASNPDTDKWTVVLQDRKYNPQMSLYLEFYSAVSADLLDPVIPGGTYTPGEGTAATAGTFIPGGDGGTRLTAIENGVPKTYYCTGGEFTTSRLDNNYTVACNLITSEGVTVTATFTGTLDIQNKIESLTIDLDRPFLGTGYYLGVDKWAEAHDYYLRLADCELDDWYMSPVDGGPGNLVHIELFSDTAPDLDNILIPEGTYPISKDYAAGTCLWRWTLVWHWVERGTCYYVRMDSGTVTVSRTGTVYNIELDGIASSGVAENFRLTATYTGEIPLRNGWPSYDEIGAEPLYSRSAVVPPQAVRPTTPPPDRSPQTAPGSSTKFRADRLTL